VQANSGVMLEWEIKRIGRLAGERQTAGDDPIRLAAGKN
jgi:hypothetical protein